ncbi:MAG: ATPase, T2SS/T4P/T4SS family [Anaerolineales bacterium]|jgi:pilus assembly protein CpaF|nr:ATPase, T2SS/T4P/T4SS family [Anaerolineales bacterium]
MDVLSLYDRSNQPASAGDPNGERAAVMNEVIDRINSEYSLVKLAAPTPELRAEVLERVTVLISAAYRRRSMRPGAQYEEHFAGELTRRLLGFGFLDLLLPPIRTDISEIAVYSSGLVQVMLKGAVRFETVDMRPEPGEIWRVLDRIIGPQNRSLNEANPVVYAKLPPSPDNPGGGRLTALHPAIAPPGKNPAINVRLFEQKPVDPAWLIERGALTTEMMADLGAAMQAGTRILICGGTRTGKTTMLSALCTFLPAAWRVVKIEDPEEIWIDRQTVQSFEARPKAIGTDVAPVTLADGVKVAMRLSPDYLIVGEARSGEALEALFSAMTTGHSGASTFHAESTRDTVERVITEMGMHSQSRPAEVQRTFASAIDLHLQIGIRHDKRRVISIAKVAKDLKQGNVWFEPIWRYDEDSTPDNPRWKRVGELQTGEEYA